MIGSSAILMAAIGAILFPAFTITVFDLAIRFKWMGGYVFFAHFLFRSYFFCLDRILLPAIRFVFK